MGLHEANYHDLDVAVEATNARNARASASLLERLRRFHPEHCPDAMTKLKAAADEIVPELDPIPEPEVTEETKIAKWVADQFREPPQYRPWNDTGKAKIGRIQNLVSITYNIDRSDLLSARRTKNVMVPRHVAIYLARKLTSKSLPQIGAAFGGRDHTTIINSIRWAEDRLPRDPELSSRVQSLMTALSEAL